MLKGSKDLRVDSKDDFSMCVGENMVMDPDTGKMHFTAPRGSDNNGQDEE